MQFESMAPGAGGKRSRSFYFEVSGNPTMDYIGAYFCIITYNDLTLKVSKIGDQKHRGSIKRRNLSDCLLIALAFVSIWA